jgi:hypothetical protein
VSSEAQLAALRPTAGARFVLELRSQQGEASATYDAYVLTPTTTFAYAAALRSDGGVTLTASGPGATPAHEAALAMFGKLTGRGAAGRHAEGLPAWPARVTRWRADK